jgi:SAM-dependent methyltransferase
VYPGTELELFAEAIRWKRYWSSQIAAAVRGAVLEVGAGLGSNTCLLLRPGVQTWVCLEPDILLAERLASSVRTRALERPCHVIAGTLAALAADAIFDAVLYLDVLEHIADDRAEVSRAVRHLRPGGALVVLAPAHPWLFNAFDEAVGHYRRYTKTSLADIVPPTLVTEKLIYLDCAGLCASLGNRLVLSRAKPSVSQLAFWDRVLVPCSRHLDRVIGFRLGKSVLGVWRAAR